MNIPNCIIEITRMCNMTCDHCLMDAMPLTAHTLNIAHPVLTELSLTATRGRLKTMSG